MGHLFLDTQYFKVRAEKNRVVEENRNILREMDRAILERDRLRYIKMDNISWPYSIKMATQCQGTSTLVSKLSLLLGPDWMLFF